jgi:hypothetical protein
MLRSNRFYGIGIRIILMSAKDAERGLRLLGDILMDKFQGFL